MDCVYCLQRNLEDSIQLPTIGIQISWDALSLPSPENKKNKPNCQKQDQYSPFLSAQQVKEFFKLTESLQALILIITYYV